MRALLLILILLLTLSAWPQETRSFLAVRTRDGAMVASQNPDRLLVPASTLKLLTAARALKMAPFETTLWLDGDVLILRGGGDPTLTRADLVELARQVRIPVTRVEVDSPDLGLPYGPGWAWDDMTEDFQPAVCGLTVDEGLTSVTVGAQGVSQKDPTARLTFRLQPDEGAPGFYLLPGRPDYVLVGHAEEPVTLQLPVPEPDLWAGRILAAQLGELPVSRGTKRGNLIAAHYSRPVREILRGALAESDNLVMETLFRQLPAGEKPPGRVVDGCGLSRYNLVSPRTLVDTLRAHPDLFALLPRPGQEGTLRNRFSDSPVRDRVAAKTGTLGNISALAGVLDAGTPDEIVFAVITNGTLDSKGTRAWEERWVSGLSEAVEGRSGPSLTGSAFADHQPEKACH